MPKNERTFLSLCGMGHFAMTSSFSGCDQFPPALKINTQNSISLAPKEHLFCLAFYVGLVEVRCEEIQRVRRRSWSELRCRQCKREKMCCTVGVGNGTIKSTRGFAQTNWHDFELVGYEFCLKKQSGKHVHGARKFGDNLR